MIESQTYFPELLSRRGELNAWIFALLATGGLILLRAWAQVPFWAWIFVILLYFSALSISLGNWMDRHTFIQISADGVVFENGLRKTQFKWREIAQVRVGPARWGKAVEVIGLNAHFEFNTLGEVRFRGEMRGRVGFAKGDGILDEIVHLAGLRPSELEEPYTIFSRG